jgi:hypothetical protein
MSRTQFSLRTLLAAVAAVGIGAASLVAEPTWQSLVALEFVSILYATIGLIGVVETSGRVRSFWMGVSLPCGLAALLAVIFLPLCFAYHDIIAYQIVLPELAQYIAEFLRPILGLFWLASLVNGLLGVLVHSLFVGDAGCQNSFSPPPEPKA